jgi:hypothetical protein
MRSYKLEYLRFGNPKGGILRAGDPYLIMRDSNPVEPKDCPFNQLELLTNLHQLRYRSNQSDKDKLDIINELSDRIKRFFLEIEERGEYPIQIDLVLNANELGLIPFELILDEQRKPLFVYRDKPLILTRRIRQNYFISKGENWPTIPRVLFAYANPNYDGYHEVPSKGHKDSLLWALRNWMDETTFGKSDRTLKILENASIESLTDALEKANNKNRNGGAKKEKPFTHLHILAHGALIPDKVIANNAEYGVALYSENEKPTRFKEITDLLASLDNKPFVVSYMICDGANNINVLQHERNIVQVTHEIGVPIVLGSQLPLTFEGSVQIATDFYNGIFNGDDVRKAIHEVRCNLFEKKLGHDWLSFVSYVRLPEGYEDYLEENNLERELAALKNISKKSEAIIHHNSKNPDDYEEIIFCLKERIDKLEEQIQKVKRNNNRVGVYEENAGLLGSAHKRWAELVFHRNIALEKDVTASYDEQKLILNQAISWYKKAADYNLSHHWSIVQYLSLQTVLNPNFDAQYYWHAAMQSAINDSKKEKEIWAFGSLAELHLLSLSGDKAAKYKGLTDAVKSLVSRSKKANDGFPIESTRKQLERYVNWWTNENGFNVPPNRFDATELKKVFELLGK